MCTLIEKLTLFFQLVFPIYCFDNVPKNSYSFNYLLVSWTLYRNLCHLLCLPSLRLFLKCVTRQFVCLCIILSATISDCFIAVTLTKNALHCIAESLPAFSVLIGHPSRGSSVVQIGSFCNRPLCLLM